MTNPDNLQLLDKKEVDHNAMFLDGRPGGAPLTTTVTLTRADSGKHYQLTQSGTAFVVTIPDPAEGLLFRFALDTASTANITIATVTGSNIHGYIVHNAAGSITRSNGASNVSFQNAAVVGDWVELVGAANGRYRLSAYSGGNAGVV